jgi:hypothetical protein
VCGGFVCDEVAPAALPAASKEAPTAALKIALTAVSKGAPAAAVKICAVACSLRAVRRVSSTHLSSQKTDRARPNYKLNRTHGMLALHAQTAKARTYSREECEAANNDYSRVCAGFFTCTDAPGFTTTTTVNISTPVITAYVCKD